MSSPQQVQEERLDQLQKDITRSTERIIDLVQQSNAIRDRALKSIATTRAAIQATHNEFLEYVNEMEIIRVEIKKIEDT